MTLKFKIKLLTNMCMTALFPLLMAYSLIGELLHEWLGVGMLIFATLHNLLNVGWYRNLFRGKYTPFRTCQMVLDILCLLCVIGLAISGVMLSRYVFVFIPINGGSSFARSLHMLCSYWGFILILLHAGMHIDMISAVARKALGSINTSKRQVIFMNIASVVLCAYGVCAFIKRNIVSYLFLKNHFVFFDFNEPLIFFFIDYAAIMVLFVFIAHLGVRLIKAFSIIHQSKKKEPPHNE